PYASIGKEFLLLHSLICYFNKSFKRFYLLLFTKRRIRFAASLRESIEAAYESRTLSGEQKPEPGTIATFSSSNKAVAHSSTFLNPPASAASFAFGKI